MRRKRPRKLGVEPLESRRLLTGDVTVTVVAGNLLIEGDDAANQIVVTSGEAAGTYVVRGLDGTTVTLDGEDEAAPATGLVVEGVRGHVHVDLGAGDDAAWVHDAQFRRGLSLNMGAGADRVTIGAAPPAAETPAPETAIVAAAESADDDEFNVSVRGSLVVRTGADDDVVTIASAEASQFIAVATDGGNDQVTIGSEIVEGGAANAAASTTVAGGAASDSDEADDSDEEDSDPPSVRAGFAIDVVLGEGDDEATIADARALGHIAVGGGMGSDEIRIAEARATAVTVRGGDGSGVDVVDLSAVKAVVAAIGTGAGADVVTIVDSAFSALGVELGAGDDKLSLASTTARRALLAGGAGSGDELDKGADVTIKKLIVTGFEIPEGANEGKPPISKPAGRILAKVVAAIRGRGR